MQAAGKKGRGSGDGELQEALNLPALPRRMSATTFNTQVPTCGSMVVFEGGSEVVD